MSELNISLFVANICTVILCSMLLPIMPLLTRKSFLFGVRVPPEAQNTNEAKALKKNYIALTIAGGIIILVASIWQYVVAPNYTFYAMLFFPLALLAIQLAAFVPNNRKALELKSRLGWNVAEISFADTKTSFTRGNLSAMPHFWYSISLIIVVASFVMALLRYPVLPDLIPTHWDFNMVPNAWSPKTLGTVLLMPIINIGTLVVMWLTGILIEKAKLQIDHNEPAKSFAQHKKYRFLMGHSMGVLALAIVVMIFILELQMLFEGFTVSMWLLLAIIIVPCVAICVVSIRAGQGGTLLKVDITEASAANGDIVGNNAMNDDKYWMWGLFYHNPDDPACFVGNRFGGNIGFNYSRWSVKIGVAIGIVALIACYTWMVIAFKPFI